MKRIQVSGKVQGVFFRQSTCNFARELGLIGKVRNLKNGGVEVLAQGDEFILQQLIEYCKVGPDLAIVESISVEDWPNRNDLPIPFEVEKGWF